MMTKTDVSSPPSWCWERKRISWKKAYFIDENGMKKSLWFKAFACRSSIIMVILNFFDSMNIVANWKIWFPKRPAKGFFSQMMAVHAPFKQSDRCVMKRSLCCAVMSATASCEFAAQSAKQKAKEIARSIVRLFDLLAVLLYCMCALQTHKKNIRKINKSPIRRPPPLSSFFSFECSSWPPIDKN